MWRCLHFTLITAAVVLLLYPLFAFGQAVRCVNSYRGMQVRTYTLPAGTLNPGANQLTSLRTDVAGAQADMGKTFFTLKLTSFNDAKCADGPCRNNIPGIAHRTWPLNSCVAVCNKKNNKCAIAIVMDRGPNTRLGCRTIDANPALQQALNMRGGTVPAEYRLLSLPPKKCDTASALSPITTDSASNITQTTSPFSSVPASYTANPSINPSSNPFTIQPPTQTTPQSVSPGSAAPSQQTISSPAAIPLSGNPYGNSQPLYPEKTVSTAPVTGAVSSPPTIQGVGSDSYVISHVALLDVQPHVVKRGESALVSWATIGMSVHPRCKVTTNSGGKEIVLGQTNEGSRKVSINTGSKTGTFTFTLRCAALSGVSVARTAILTVR